MTGGSRSLADIRVLLVEDEAVIAMMVEDMLSELGCGVVTTAARLGDALVKAGTMAIDVAVLDVNLAGELSYPVALLLRTRGIPLFFTTGYGARGMPDALVGSVVVTKPFGFEELEEALRTVLPV